MTQSSFVESVYLWDTRTSRVSKIMYLELLCSLTNTGVFH